MSPSAMHSTKQNLIAWQRQQAEHNRQFVAAQIKLPSGATYTICRGSTAAAAEPEVEEEA